MEVEAGVWHVYARANDRKALFVDDVDRRRYLARLAVVVGRQAWHLLSYCLMGNHMHLLVETQEPNLGDGMRLLHGPYAQRFNARHARDGHVFRGRYGSVRVTTDAQLWATASYIAANPVSAGLCRRPEDWRWSSYAAATRDESPAWLASDRLYAHFSVFGGAGRQRYASFVEGMLARA